MNSFALKIKEEVEEVKEKRRLKKVAQQRPANYFNSNEHEFIREKMFDLPNDQMTIVYLRFWKNMSPEEISQNLGLRSSVVNKTLESVLNSLKKDFMAGYSQWISEKLKQIERGGTKNG